LRFFHTRSSSPVVSEWVQSAPSSGRAVEGEEGNFVLTGNLRRGREKGNLDFSSSSSPLSTLRPRPPSSTRPYLTPASQSIMAPAFAIPSSSSDRKMEKLSSHTHSSHSTLRGAHGLPYSPSYSPALEQHSISLGDVARWRQANPNERLRPGNGDKATLASYRCVL
jgi:hypothetical protein